MGATGYIIKGHNGGRGGEARKAVVVSAADGTIDVEKVETFDKVDFRIKTTYDGYETISVGSMASGGYFKAAHIKFNEKNRRYRLVCILNGGSYTPVAKDFAIYYIKFGWRTGGVNADHWYIEEYSRQGNGAYVSLEQIALNEYNVLIHTPTGYAYANIGILKEDKEPDVTIDHFNNNTTRYTPTGTIIETETPDWKNGALVDTNPEDLTIRNGLLQLADRSSTNGLGYVILRPDKTFAEQVNQPNTIYEIRYDFDIEGTFELDNISLFLNGGSLKLKSNNFAFVNSNRISIIALNGEEILANSQSSIGIGDGLLEFRTCKDITVRGVNFNYADVNKNFIYLNSCVNTKIDYNTFTGLVTGSGEPKKCVYSIGSQSTSITNNIMENVRGGITLGNTYGKDKDAIVSNNIMDTLYLSGVNCFAENVSFTGNVFRNVGFGGQVTCIAVCGDGLSGIESTNITISGNTFIASCNAIQADCTRGGYIRDITIVGNSISECERGAYMASTRGNLIIANNSFEKINTIGIDCTDVNDAIITSNRIKGTSNTQYGIRVLPLETTYVSQNAGDIDVIGNRIDTTGQGLYVGQTTNNYCEAIRCINNAISNCDKGITATSNTEGLLIDGNVLQNTTDLDLRTSSFELRDNNKYTTISSYTHIEKVIDTSTETPIIKQNGTYTISSDTSYTLRGFSTQEDVNRITIVVLSDNITIAKNAQLYPLCGQSFMPLVNSSLTFEKMNGLWKEIGFNGNLNVVTEQTLPTTTRRKGLAVYDDTLSMPAYSTGNKWICADGYSAKKRQGTTQERPVLTGDIGFRYFDTDLGKPIYWTGSKWVDANGNDLQ